jgi:hypothetical protein
MQPFAGSHASSVHGLPSSQDGVGPARQTPKLHVSCSVHAFPSSHGAVLFAWTQPLAGLHESSVHALLSLQFNAGPPAQAPFAHRSPVVQALPSLHAFVLFVKTQPVTGLHESVVQALPSSQTSGAPVRQIP